MSALAHKAKENAIVVVEDLALEAPKTKNFAAALKALNISGKKTLYVLPENNDNLYLSLRNIPSVEGILLSDMNTYDIVNAQVLVLVQGGRVRVYVPAAVVPLLHERVANYPNVVAEGGVNFWDAFQLVAVGDHFWHDGLHLETFAVRHHWPRTAFALRVPGSLVWTGDTRPIPELLAHHAGDGELVAHDCALHGNPSHSGLDDLEREYPPGLLARCVLYHYGSAAEAETMRARGMRVADPGEAVQLAEPRPVAWS